MQEWRRLVKAVDTYGKETDARCERDQERAFVAYVVIGDERYEFDISRNINQIDEDVQTFFKNFTVNANSLYAPKYDTFLSPEQIRNHASLLSYADGVASKYFPLMSPCITFGGTHEEYESFTVMLATGAHHGFKVGAHLCKEDKELFILKTLMGLAIDFYPDLSKLMKSLGWWDADKVHILDVVPGNTLRLSAANKSGRFDATPDNLEELLEFMSRHSAYTQGWKAFCSARDKYGREPGHPNYTTSKHHTDPRVAFIEVAGGVQHTVLLNRMAVEIDNDVWRFFNPKAAQE